MIEINNKTIVITDPYFISKRIDWGTKFNYKECKIDSNLNFKNYLWEATDSRENSWKISELNDVVNEDRLTSFINDIEDSYNEYYNKPTIDNQIKLETLIKERNTIGRFNTLSRTFGVFLLDEILSYNSEFLLKIKKISPEYEISDYSIINNFSGIIKTYFDKNKLFHLIGIGNKSFYSNTVNYI